jgi:hypothetical protein
MYMLNLTNNQMLANSMIPYQIWYKVKLLVVHVHIFGSSAYVYIPKKLRRKLDKKKLALHFHGLQWNEQGISHLG